MDNNLLNTNNEIKQENIKTNYEFVMSLNQPQFSAFMTVQICKFLESQGLSMTQESMDSLIDTYNNWLEKKCNIQEFDTMC